MRNHPHFRAPPHVPDSAWQTTSSTVKLRQKQPNGPGTPERVRADRKSVGDVTAAAIELRANADILAGAGLLATGTLSVDAGGTFTLAGLARGSSVTINSSDISLGNAAQLGSRGVTSDLTILNSNAAVMTSIGGATQSGYSLDRNEAARMFADESITILADGDITIDDLALTFGPGGANLGAGGLLEISTPERVDIIGDVALRTSGPDDTFRIDPRLIALDIDIGSISMLTGEGGGTPQGRLELIGDRVVAATAANIAQLETLAGLDAITALLDVPGGTGDTLAAGAIDISVDDGLYIQNSGASDAFEDRRGFAARALNVDTGSASTQIAINGQILGTGGPVTGLDVTELVTINGAPAAPGGQFAPRSTINGCVIGENCAFVPIEPPTNEDFTPVDPSDPSPSLFVAPLIELAGTEPLITPPLVDEPITGVGNDDLWEPRCEPGEDNGPCPEDDRQP
jgi:hypothetical protein